MAKPTPSEIQRRLRILQANRKKLSNFRNALITKRAEKTVNVSTAIIFTDNDIYEIKKQTRTIVRDPQWNYNYTHPRTVKAVRRLEVNPIRVEDNLFYRRLKKEL